MSRRAAGVIASAAALLWSAGCDEAGFEQVFDHAVDAPIIDQLTTESSGVTCNPSLQRYPIAGPHNGGWDPNALNFTCGAHPASSPDNSDWIGGQHYGNDLFSAKGAPAVSPVSGVVTNVSTTSIGGNNVTVKDGCGWYYYHAHLNSFASGLFVGKNVQAGDPIGTVGDTGSAQGTQSHIHFSIFPGTYTAGVDPFPYLQQVDAGACSGGGTTPTPTAHPNITIKVEHLPPSGQAADIRPEGDSNGILDAYEGQTFKVRVIVKNAAGAKVASDVHVGVWLESPYLEATAYTIYSDWPAKNGATWVVNDANGLAANPSHSSPPTSGRYRLNAMSPGESKKIELTVRAKRYSIGKVDHPDVRAWVWHVPGWYSEKTSWSDTAETNVPNKNLRAYKQHDVYALDRWEFEANTAAETEGWTAGNGLNEVAVNTVAGALALKQAGGDPYAIGPKASINAAQKKAIQLEVRTYNGDQVSRLYFRTAADNTWTESKSKEFLTVGDGEFHVVKVDMSDVPAWSGTVTKLRLDPSLTSTEWYDVAELKAINAAALTTGDGDDDGYLGSPGDDCDDGDAFVNPGATEVCNGRDDNCDGEVDEGFGVGSPCAVGEGACSVSGSQVCTPDGSGTECAGAAGQASAEVCNGLDDDCDGETDEDSPVGEACTLGAGSCLATGVFVCGEGGAVLCDAELPEGETETCNGIDDDCDGDVDEDGACGVACLPGSTGPCIVNGAAFGCEHGSRSCDDSGAWGPCELSADCSGGAGDADTTGGSDGGGPDGVDDGVSGRVGEVTVSHQQSEKKRDVEGCGAAGGTGGLLWWLSALGLFGVRRRVARAHKNVRPIRVVEDE